MRIGLVGKPNVGKSTAFSALTETPVEIANYPFTTIEPNVGVAWLPLRENCACKELRDRKEKQGRIAFSSEDDVAKVVSVNLILEPVLDIKGLFRSLL